MPGETKMKKSTLYRIIGISLFCFIFLSIGEAKEKTRIITPGDFFPEFSFPMTLSEQDEEYLGIPPTHFIFTFNEQGPILNFLPLQVIKKNNLPCDEKEIEKMKKRLVGRSILQAVYFDPQVDAVSSATMTAAVVVDSINKAKNIYDGLKHKGYIK